MNESLINTWNDIELSDKQDIFNEVAGMVGLPVAAAAEKDWWVVRTLELVFQTEIAPYTVFKGGTSLSKAWNLIDRFSEDIDLALDRRFLGFEKTDVEMTPSQVSKLRKRSFKYITEKFIPILTHKYIDAGFSNILLLHTETNSTDEDPVKIEVKYPSVTEKSRYLPPRVLIEIGSRSMIEPYSEKRIISFVGEQFKRRKFADTEITIPVVNPERTFLEKVFLLHEEFQQPIQKIKVERKSRHMYDLEKLMDTEFAERAITDTELYKHIVVHRKAITPLRGIDYTNHVPEKIDLIPPAKVMDAWKKDYQQMQESMIYKESLPFIKLMERITELNARINRIKLSSY